MPAQGATRSMSEDAIAEQIAAWWAEAETASRANHIPRARRFLRWILAVQPDDEEVWLRLAELASALENEMAYLRQAISFHPDSPRIVAALRQARSRQLESAVSGLLPQSLSLRCLPDQRGSGRCHAVPRNGKQPQPTGDLEGTPPSQRPNIGSRLQE